jgi:hypothetical protein
MNFTHSGAIENPSHIRCSDGAAGHHNNPPLRRSYEARNHVGSFLGSRNATRRKNAIRTCADHVLERGKQVGRGVKGTVKSDFQRPRELNQLLGPGHIDAPVRAKYSKDHSIYTELLRKGNVPFHNLELIGRIAEISGPRANEDMQCDCRPFASHGNQAGRRSDPTFGKTAAQFYPLGPALFGCHRGGD